MAQILLGVNNIAKSPASILFGGSDGRAVRLNSGFYGDADGKAKQIFASDIIVEYHAEFECWGSFMMFMPRQTFSAKYTNINNYVKIINPSSISNSVTLPVTMTGLYNVGNDSYSANYTAFKPEGSITKNNPIFKYTNSSVSFGEKPLSMGDNPYVYFYVSFNINGIDYTIYNQRHLFTTIDGSWVNFATVNTTKQIIIPA